MSATSFLNIDIDLSVRSGLEDLLESIALSVTVLHKNSQEASFELIEHFDTLESAASELLKVVEALPVRAKEIWNNCEYRRMNIGIQSGHEPHAAMFAMSEKTIVRLADNHFEIILTVYGPLD